MTLLNINCTQVWAGWQCVHLLLQLQCHSIAMIAGCVTSQHVASVVVQTAHSLVMDTLQGLQPKEKRLLMLVQESRTIRNSAHGEQSV